MRQRPVLSTRHPSPAAQRRAAELWKARLGLGAAVIITVFSLVVMYRIAGVGVQTMLAVSQNTLTTVVGLGTSLGLPLPEFLTTLEISPAPAGTSPATGQPPTDATTAQPPQAPAPTAAVMPIRRSPPAPSRQRRRRRLRRRSSPAVCASTPSSRVTRFLHSPGTTRAVCKPSSQQTTCVTAT